MVMRRDHVGAMAFSHSSRPSLAEASPIKKRPGTWRPLWRKIHLYLGFGSGLVLLVLALSGITLIFSDDLDRLLHPDFYATTGAEAALTPDVYLAAATAVVPEGAATQLRWPRTTGAPVTVLVRAEPKHRATDQGADHTATKKDMDAAPPGNVATRRASFSFFLIHRPRGSSAPSIIASVSPLLSSVCIAVFWCRNGSGPISSASPASVSRSSA